MSIKYETNLHSKPDIVIVIKRQLQRIMGIKNGDYINVDVDNMENGY